jgi:phage terminase large subunit-like protein
VLLIAATPAEARDIMIEGESGLLFTGPPDERPEWFPANRLLKWRNGAVGHVRSGADPDGVRGLQGDTGWLDELAAWNYARETWDLAQFCFRLGDPRICVTTTPKPIMLVRELLGMEGVVVSRGSTYDNIDNLAPAFIKQIISRYEGTNLGQQEIYAAVLDEAEDALWKRGTINETRCGLEAVPELERVVVAIDPAAKSNAESNETGIVVAARGVDKHGYLFEDLSGRFSPDRWARKAVDAFERHGGDRVVGEVNNGGEMVEHTLRTVAPNVPFKAVHASKGKRTRAEPIAALYEQKRIHHVGLFEALEDQMCTWEPNSGQDSPDRLDATVWAFHELFPSRGEPKMVSPGAVGRGPSYWKGPR